MCRDGEGVMSGGDCTRRGVNGRDYRLGSRRKAEPVHRIKDTLEIVTEFALEVLVHFLEFKETRSYAG